MATARAIIEQQGIEDAATASSTPPATDASNVQNISPAQEFPSFYSLPSPYLPCITPADRPSSVSEGGRATMAETRNYARGEFPMLENMPGDYESRTFGNLSHMGP